MDFILHFHEKTKVAIIQACSKTLFAENENLSPNLEFVPSFESKFRREFCILLPGKSCEQKVYVWISRWLQNAELSEQNTLHCIFI